MGITDYLSRDASGTPEPESNYDEKFVVASISNFFKACDSIRSFNRPLNCGRVGCRKQKQPPSQANYIGLNRAAPNIKSNHNCPTNLVQVNHSKTSKAGRLDKNNQNCPDKHAQNFRPIRNKYANLKAKSIAQRCRK